VIRLCLRLQKLPSIFGVPTGQLPLAEGRVLKRWPYILLND
jgi:hypothetical protein